MKSLSDHQHRLTAARDAVVEAAKEQYMAFIKPTESDDRAIWLDKYVSACKWTQRNVAHLLEVESERAVASAKKEAGGE